MNTANIPDWLWWGGHGALALILAVVAAFVVDWLRKPRIPAKMPLRSGKVVTNHTQEWGPGVIIPVKGVEDLTSMMTVLEPEIMPTHPVTKLERTNPRFGTVDANVYFSSTASPYANYNTPMNPELYAQLANNQKINCGELANSARRALLP